MDKLYEKIQEKNEEKAKRAHDIEQQQQQESNRESFDEHHDRKNEKRERNDFNASLERRLNSASKKKSNPNRQTFSIEKSNSMLSVFKDLLGSSFEDTRYKGKQFNCGKFSATAPTKSTFNDKRFKKPKEKDIKELKKEIEREMLLKSLQVKEQKSLPKFVCGKYKDPEPYPKTINNKNNKIKEKLRSRSANDMYLEAKLYMEKQQKTHLKPFIAGKVKKTEKIEHFSPLSVQDSFSKTSSRSPKELLDALSGKLRISSKLIEALDLEKKKQISEKPLKFGKVKREDERNLYTDPIFKNKDKAKKIEQKSKLDKELEAFIEQEKKRKERIPPMKFGKVEQKPHEYFSPEKRLTLSPYSEELRRSARNSARTSMNNSKII